MGDVEGDNSEGEQSTKEDAKSFLTDLLKYGAVDAPEVEREAKAAGYPIATIRRAKAALKVDSKKTGMDGGWQWALPEVPKMLTETRRCSHTQDERLREDLSTFDRVDEDFEV